MVKITPDTLERLLRQIACGQLDADAAARTVLGIDGSEPPPPETIGGLIRGFGPPPAEIQRDWQRQFEAFSVAWRQSRGEPVPPFEPDDWFVAADNRISPRWLAGEPDAPWDSGPTARSEAHPPNIAVSEGPRAVENPSGTNENDSGKKKSGPRFGGHRRPLVLVTIFALTGCGYLAVRRLSPTANSQASRSSAPSSPQAKPSPTAPPPTAGTRPQVAPDRPGQDSPVSIASASLVPATVEGEPELQLLETALVPQSHDSRPRELGPPDPLDDLASPLDPLPSLPPAEASQSESAGETAGEPNLPPDQHRVALPASGQESITLPPFSPADQPAVPLLLTARPIRQVAWEFPAGPAPPIALRTRSEQAWSLVDSEQQRELATLKSTEEGLVFAWAEDAARHATADQVAAGRLRLTAADQGRFDLLLRPSLRCEPMSLDLSQPDARFSWQLDGPPIYASPLWTLEFDESEAVELAWLESPDPSQVRRGQARVRWKLPEDDFPLIGCHLESRVTSRWTLRLRYAVQLSETSPWQPFSTRQLTQALEKMTVLLNQSLLQQSELARQYSLATSTIRRQLKPAKETLDQQVLGLQDTMTRLRKLNDLANALTGIRFKLGLTTAWPDRRQVIFEMVDAP